ncbi:NADH dehydrogenase [ubiquinone] 1 alpha subcomplex subunit 9, mitochondrial [alpha proteobacterium Q-1]|nr:NADH dehydrogenase [ubiquinone] 1 alpha subcomplex subunit 9, mitochondrial [alpha proteobacterium Q-1]
MPIKDARLATVFGGSGFIGRAVVQRLARAGYRIRVAVRHPDNAYFLKPLGEMGQIHAVPADLTNAPSIKAALAGSDIAINLVGILSQSGRQRFDLVQAKGAGLIARTAAELGISDLVHLSAIGADAASPSLYAISKAQGEQAVRDAFPKAHILRPSLVFGPDDAFTNRFAALAKKLPFMPVIAGETRFQPVYVGDVADAVLAALRQPAPEKATLHELGGPKIYSFRALLGMILHYSGQKRPLLDIPMPLARLQASFLQYLPSPPLTPDQLLMLQQDNIVHENTPGLRDLGISPTAAEAILPGYLDLYAPQGRFTRPRNQ